MKPRDQRSNSTRPAQAPDASAGASPDLSEGAGEIEAGDGLKLIALGGLTVLLIWLCARLAMPVLPAITWGVALAILAFPMNRWIARRVKWPGLAAGLSSAVVVVVILGTMTFITFQMTNQARTAVRQVKEKTSEAELLERAKSLPFVGPAVGWVQGLGLDIEEEAGKRIGAFGRDAAALARGSATAAVQFLVAIFILFFLLKEPGTFLGGLRGMLPLNGEESDLILGRAGDAIYANLYATLVTSFIDTAGFALLFWWAGIPAWPLWAAVMFLLGILPILGAGVVWIPVATYLAFSGQWGPMIALLTWGAITFTLVDNALRARMVGDRMRMHEVPTLIAILGGLAIFGMSGIVLGPLILSLTSGVVDVWKRRMGTAA